MPEMKPRHVRYVPPKPVANNGGLYAITITMNKEQWQKVDAFARVTDLSRAIVARRILDQAMASPDFLEGIKDQ